MVSIALRIDDASFVFTVRRPRALIPDGERQKRVSPSVRGMKGVLAGLIRPLLTPPYQGGRTCGTALIGNDGEQFFADSLDFRGRKHRQFVGVSDEHRQIAQTIDTAGNTARELENRGEGIVVKHRLCAPGDFETMADVAGGSRPATAASTGRVRRDAR